eukprot:g346.t1 g346   contig1:838211-839114(-)
MSSVQPEQPDAEERGGERKEVFPLATQIVSMSLGFIAFIMSAVAAGGCDFARAKNSGFWYTSEYNIGLFQGGNDGVFCSRYSGSGLSASIRAAQAFGTMAALFGGIVWFTCMFQLALRFPKWLWRTVAGVFIFCFFSQMLTLVVLEECKDESKCKLGSDGITSIFAALFYLGIGIAMFVCPIPKTAVVTSNKWTDCCKIGGNGACDCCGEQSTTQSTVQDAKKNSPVEIDSNNVVNSVTEEKYNADGTITVKEQHVEDDGTKVITITTKQCASV